MIEGLYYLTTLTGILLLLIIMNRNIREGLLVFLTYTTFGLFSFPWFIFPVNGIAFISFSVSMLLAVGYLLYNANKAFISKDRLIFPSGLFIMLLFTAFFIPVGQYNSYGIEKLQFFFLNNFLPILLLMCIVEKSEKDFKLIFYTIVFGSFLGALKLLNVADFSSIRLGSDVTPLTYARNIGIGAILLLTYLLHSRKLIRLKTMLFVFMLIIMLFAVLITGSRAPSIGIFLAILISIIIYNIGFKRRLLFSIRVVFFIVAILTVFILSSINVNDFLGIQRILAFGSHGLASGTGDIDVSRAELLSSAIKGIIQTNLLGSGTGTFQFFTNSVHQYPHNLLIEIILELSVFAGILFIILTFLSFFRVRNILKAREVSVYELGLSTLWIYGFTNAMVSGNLQNNILWITLALIWVIPLNINKIALHEKQGA